MLSDIDQRFQKNLYFVVLVLRRTKCSNHANVEIDWVHCDTYSIWLYLS